MARVVPSAEMNASGGGDNCLRKSGQDEALVLICGFKFEGSLGNARRAKA